MTNLVVRCWLCKKTDRLGALLDVRDWFRHADGHGHVPDGLIPASRRRATPNPCDSGGGCFCWPGGKVLALPGHALQRLHGVVGGLASFVVYLPDMMQRCLCHDGWRYVRALDAGDGHPLWCFRFVQRLRLPRGPWTAQTVPGRGLRTMNPVWRTPPRMALSRVRARW